MTGHQGAAKTQAGGWAQTVLGAGERRATVLEGTGERNGRRVWVLSFCAGKGQAHAFFTESRVLFAAKFKHRQAVTEDVRAGKHHQGPEEEESTW